MPLACFLLNAQGWRCGWRRRWRVVTGWVATPPAPREGGSDVGVGVNPALRREQVPDALPDRHRIVPEPGPGDGEWGARRSTVATRSPNPWLHLSLGVGHHVQPSIHHGTVAEAARRSVPFR